MRVPRELAAAAYHKRHFLAHVAHTSWARDIITPPFYQAEGLHHVGSSCPHQSKAGLHNESELACAAKLWTATFDNFNAHLACGGTLFMSDHVCWPEDYHIKGKTKVCWVDAANEWSISKNYNQTVKNNPKVHGESDTTIDVKTTLA